MIRGDMSEQERDDLVLALAAGEVAAFASDLPEHQTPSCNTLQF